MMNYGTFSSTRADKTNGTADVHAERSRLGALAGRTAFHVANLAGFNPTVVDTVAKQVERAATREMNKAAISAKAQAMGGTYEEAMPLLG